MLDHPIIKLVILSIISILIPFSGALNTDGVLLLSFKYSILTDPASALRSWNPDDADPCSWHGVRCGGPVRVFELSLPNSQLVGPIPSELALIEFLQVLDLSNNSLNGSLPSTFANATRLRFLDLSNNSLTGELPDSLSGTAALPSLQFLNLSDNALAGTLPASLSALQNLTVVALRGNRLSGDIPSQLNAVKVLDLSCNLFNGSLPSEFNGGRLSFLNLSYNSLSGPIPQKFAEGIPVNATVDLSYNNLTGQVPDSPAFLNQMASSFTGNTDLCGDPTRNICPIPSSASPTSSPAIAAIPRTDDVSPADANHEKSRSTPRLRSGTVIGIVVGDVAGVLVISLVFFYVYYLKKKRRKSWRGQNQNGATGTAKSTSPVVTVKDDWMSTASTSPDSKGFSRWSCLRKGSSNDDDEESVSTSTETDLTDDPTRSLQAAAGGTLVTVDGAKQLELETLLKASAYILGATGSSIMYKAVLEDGTAFAVRRIGESHVERFRDFENQVRVVSKLVHPNLVRIRGFYWGIDEKLIIYDFVPNGSLANARYRKAGTSPCPLPWEARLRIAKGVARGLSFLHEKRHVHGNLKPSNILLGSDMEPKIGDFGLERLVTGDTSYKGGSARTFGSKRSTALHDMDLGLGPSPSPSPSSIGGLSLYFAPESLRSLKPNPKWDVYSFGVILLELLTGKIMVVDEMGQGSNGLTVEAKSRALRMADVAIRADVEGKEDALLACFKLGYGCASPVPQKRPSMKEAMQVLDKFPSASATYLCGHL